MNTHTAALAASALTNGNERKACVCSTPHKSKLCDEERIRIARNMPGVDKPDRYAMTSEARRGTYDAVYLSRRRVLEKQAIARAPERDTSACPDCEGKGLFYPSGNTPEGRLKGVVKCSHPCLDEELERPRREGADAQEELHWESSGSSPGSLYRASTEPTVARTAHVPATDDGAAT
ncbi:MAG TPA: hypothetical protein VD835_15010 [Pyrinomonadaceae bacterium]|nr:hypothetical protein [Pyrinomonadaceae bacterium]